MRADAIIDRAYAVFLAGDITAKEFEAFMLHQGGYSYEDIAERLGVVKGTARDRVVRAKRKLGLKAKRAGSLVMEQSLRTIEREEKRRPAKPLEEVAYGGQGRTLEIINRDGEHVIEKVDEGAFNGESGPSTWGSSMIATAPRRNDRR